MSFETISIYRDYPVINGFVQIPPNEEPDKNSTTLEEALQIYADSSIMRLTGRSGDDVGMKFGQQTSLRFLTDLV